MMDSTLAYIDRLTANASPEPWTVEVSTVDGAVPEEGMQHYNNLIFAAAARTYMSRISRIVREYRALLQRVGTLEGPLGDDARMLLATSESTLEDG